MKLLKAVFRLFFLGSSLAITLFTISITPAMAQGNIITACTSSPNPLDPNNDGFITNNTNGSGGAPGLFTSAALEQSEFELNLTQLPLVEDPAGDNQGAACGPSDIVIGQYGGQASSAYYALQDPDNIPNNGDERYIFRLRLAKQTTGAFGFSVLIDTDGLSGANDPNSVTGNPGFEIEIRLNSGASGGVFVDNVDGTTSGTNIVTYSGNTNYQYSRAADRTPSCGTIANNSYPVFYDFFVPLSVLGFSSFDPVRIVPATSQSGNTVLGGSAADIGGIDDGTSSSQDALFETILDLYTPTPLPVELTVFKGVLIPEGISIHWQTASEINSSYFDIERSSDAMNFMGIGTVLAKGNSNILSDYSFLDAEPEPGIHYYRLKQVDFDGSVEYSKIIAIASGDDLQKELKLVPNPVIRGENIYLIASMPLQYMEVRDVSGRIIKISGRTNGSDSVIGTTDMPRGIYYLKAITEEGQPLSSTFIVN